MQKQNIKVLVVENDLLFLQLLTCYLQLEKYEVRAACNGPQGIEQAEVSAPDLILLDVDAGQHEASTICQCIRERSLAPIICLIARWTGEKSSLIELQADDYLWKPFDADELLSHMQQMTRHGLLVEIEPVHTKAFLSEPSGDPQ